MATTRNSEDGGINGVASWIGSAIYALGLVSIFVGERLIGAGKARAVASIGGAVLVLAAMIWRGIRMAKARGDRQRVERIVLVLQAVGLFAVSLYFDQSDLMNHLLGKPLDKDHPQLAVALQAIFPVVLLASSLPLLLVELSYASMARAPHLEVGRVRDAMYSGLGMAFALTFAFAAVYVASVRDKKVDLSYFRTAKAGEATQALVRSLTEPVQIAIFFPPGNEVEGEVKNYLDGLSRESKLLEVASFDHAADPAKAKELGVSANGMLVVSKGTRREQLSVGVELEAARNQLKNLDKEVQKRLLAVARPQRTIYLTQGHGERLATPTGDTDKRPTVRALREYLQSQGYRVADLGAAEGLANDVPSDASAVMVLGPTEAFLAEESASIGRYFDRGGHLFIALDPEAGLDMKDLLAPLGLAFTPLPIADDRQFAPHTNQPSDRMNVITSAFSSNPSVASLGRAHKPIVFVGVGALTQLKDKPAGTVIDFTVRSPSTSWQDADGNFQLDAPKEARKTWDLAAAVTRKPTLAKDDKKDDKKDPKKDAKDAKKDAKSTGPEEGRAIVMGDSDVIADAIIPYLGNGMLVLDGARWLLGDEALAGETSSEVDLPIAHTHDQDTVWFYATIFLAPALALAAGWLLSRRRRRARRGGATTAADAENGVRA